jgi:hypothetical protein
MCIRSDPLACRHIGRSSCVWAVLNEKLSVKQQGVIAGSTGQGYLSRSPDTLPSIDASKCHTKHNANHVLNKAA